MTPAEAAGMLDIEPEELDVLLVSGELPSVECDGETRIEMWDVISFRRNGSRMVDSPRTVELVLDWGYADETCQAVVVATSLPTVRISRVSTPEGGQVDDRETVLSPSEARLLAHDLDARPSGSPIPWDSPEIHRRELWDLGIHVAYAPHGGPSLEICFEFPHEHEHYPEDWSGEPINDSDWSMLPERFSDVLRAAAGYSEMLANGASVEDVRSAVLEVLLPVAIRT